MKYQQNTIQNFCRQLSESYSFDGKVAGLDDLAQGVIVAAVSQSDLADSGRFKREELAARLAEEPTRSMTLFMSTNDLETSHVLTEEGLAYSISGSRLGAVEGAYVFKPVPIGRREFTPEEKQLFLNAA